MLTGEHAGGGGGAWRQSSHAPKFCIWGWRSVRAGALSDEHARAGEPGMLWGTGEKSSLDTWEGQVKAGTY